MILGTKIDSMKYPNTLIEAELMCNIFIYFSNAILGAVYTTIYIQLLNHTISKLFWCVLVIHLTSYNQVIIVKI